jgi:hypothetical protein
VTIEPHSPTWLALEQLLARRIAELHRDNEAVGLAERETAFVRGQLAAFREVVNLPLSLKKGAVAPDPYEGVLL